MYENDLRNILLHNQLAREGFTFIDYGKKSSEVLGALKTALELDFNNPKYQMNNNELKIELTMKSEQLGLALNLLQF